jgi:glycosyltransferase involved in cell wall biosynthesis
MSATTGCDTVTRSANSAATDTLARVLVVHNHYQQPGGEDRVFRAEVELLRRRGHAVCVYTVDNATIGGGPRARLALETVWSPGSARKLGQVLREFRPDVAHFHNTFPLISPAAYYACQSADVAVVQTLHHYRWGCPKATLYRDGRVCEDCLGKLVAWPGALHGCYRDSRATSAVIGVMNATHSLLGTWQGRVSRYIALSQFQRSKLMAAGLPGPRIAVKGNFVDPDPGPGDCRESYLLYVGRLIPEKGVLTLLKAWRKLGGEVPLKIVGDGVLAGGVASTAAAVPGVEWLGSRTSTEVLELMGRARALIVPSEWHEPFGLVAIEAFAKGTPVIAARAGALPEIVDHGHTGLLFTRGSAEDLLGAVRWAASHASDLTAMGRAARQKFERSYTSERNYASLIGIYRQALVSTP